MFGGLAYNLVLTLSQTSPGFYKSFENNVGKGENARDENLENFMPFSSNLKLSSANFLSLEESEICRLGIT